MFGPVRAIVVDDKPSHLFAISAGFAAAQIPCMPFWYDQDESLTSKKLKPTPRENGYQYLRIIFMDLNLEENLSQDLVNVILPAINVIKELVYEAAGPYGVVFWTGTSFKIEDIRAELLARLESNEIPLPVAVDELEKGTYVSADIGDKTGEEVLSVLYSYVYEKADDLRSDVEAVIAKYGLLRMLSEWESRAIAAAGDATNQLYSAALIGRLDDEELQDAMRKISALVAKEAVGQQNAIQNPSRAFDAAMLDVLVDTFGKSLDHPEYAALVSNELPASAFSDGNFSDSARVYAVLNTILHLDIDPGSTDIVERGLVVSLNDAKASGLEIDEQSICSWDDFFVDPRKNDDSLTKLSKVSEETVGAFRSIVRDLNAKADEIMKKAVLRCRQLRKSEMLTEYERLKNNVNECKEAVEWVLIESGAACDHTQKKRRTIRFLVGVVVPVCYVDSYVRYGPDHKLKNDALKLLGPYEQEGEIFYLLVSLKRFVAWQEPDQAVAEKSRFRLRSAVVDFLLSNYAAWSMRPGIMEFTDRT